MRDLTIERTKALERVVDHLRGRDVRFERGMNSRREENLQLFLSEAPDVHVLVEYVGAGDYRYRLTLVNKHDAVRQALLIGGVVSAYFVYRMYVDAQLFWVEATPEDIQEAMQDPKRSAFVEGFIEGRR